NGLKKAAKDNRWGIFVEELSEDEDAPVLIESSFLGKFIRPVFNFMNTLPGYREFDVSIVFLVFFSIFFAMLIGDAGYGILFLLGTYFASTRFKSTPREPFILFYILSVATIVWGALTGTWFGVEKIARLPFFSIFVIKSIDGFVDANQINIIQLCFTLGVIHLTIARAMLAVRLINSLKAMGQLGWILILWGFYFLAGKLVLNKEMPGFALWFIYAGLGLAVFFTNFNRKNYLKSMLSGLLSLPLNIIGSFSDIVSYLRLFAVGYASITVASSFNKIALDMGLGGFFGSLVFALILLFGHGLNIILGGMAVIVHGIRLNMLEFSGHLGMQWSGVEYKPFKR
ncbi:MAG: hypothetical protein ABIH57_00845, partial [Candidatus Omnitrophota bacterium]